VASPRSESGNVGSPHFSVSAALVYVVSRICFSSLPQAVHRAAITLFATLLFSEAGTPSLFA
jgi:hypothetical protein